MKKSFKLLVAILLLSTTGFTQNLDLKWGPELEDHDKSNINSILGKDEVNLYAFRSRPRGSKSEYYLDSYDLKTMNINFSNEILIPENANTKDKDFILEDCFMLNGKLFIYASSFDKKADIKIAVMFGLDTKSGKVSDKYIEVDKIIGLTKSSKGSFEYTISEDSSKILFYHQVDVGKKEPEQFSANLFDSDFKLIWKKNFVSKELDRDITLLNFEIDKDGTFYQLMKVAEKVEKDKNEPNYRYLIQAYSAAKDEIKFFDLKLGENFITDIRFEIAKDGNLICAGFYSERNVSLRRSKDAAYDRASGVFYMKIDKSSQEVKASQIKAFDKEVFMDVLEREKSARKAKDLTNFDIRDFIFKDDGSMYMVCEQYYVVVITTRTQYGTTSSYNYHYNAILTSSFNADGTIKWTKAINKLQLSVNDKGFYSSFLKFVVGDKIYFIYNDDKDNIDLAEERKRQTMTNPKKAMTMLTILDIEGKIKTTPLFNSKELETICRPKISYQNKNGEAIIFGEKRSKYRFGTVTVK